MIERQTLTVRADSLPARIIENVRATIATTHMTKEKFLILGVLAAAALTAIGFHIFGGGNRPGGAAALPTTGQRPVIATTPHEFLGVTLQLMSGDVNTPYEEYLREIAATGANTVCLVPRAYQENGSSTSIFMDLRKNLPTERLKQIIRYASSEDPATGKHAMKVIVMPLVLLENARNNEWRGKIAPEKWDDWWDDYTEYILHYARIAQETGVDVLMVGSELVSTESQTQRWEKLVQAVRYVYKGRLGYSANWDHYAPITWWNKLDVIGMTTYYDLTDGGKEPTSDRLMQEWGKIKKEILTWRNANYPDRPILFTEVGWPNQVTCAQYSWDYYRAMDKPAPQLQADCFETFFRTWMDEDAAAGYLVWEWRSYPGQKTGHDDTSYTPCGKPAEDVIRKHYQAAALTMQKRNATAGTTLPTSVPTSVPAESQPAAIAQ